jgi:hypothetical protein
MKIITIVSGFGRCGSSLVMQMLAAGGMPTPYSSYPSYEIERKTKMFMANLYGGALKVLDPHVSRPPKGGVYQFIWLDRDLNEQAKSMAKFIGAANPGLPPITDDKLPILVGSFKKDRPKCMSLMHNYTQRILKLRFEDILADPAGTAAKLNAFCGGQLNEEAMVKAVRPRGPECLPYLMEFEQMAEARGENGPETGKQG